MWCIYIYIYIHHTHIYTYIYAHTYIYTYTHTYIHIYMEYYLALKKNDILPFLVKRMDLENTMISEITHTEKDKYSIVKLPYGI